MLNKYVINVKNNINSHNKLKFNNVIINDDNITFVCPEKHHLKNEDEIIITNKFDYDFYNKKKITYIDEYTFSVTKNDLIQLKFDKVEKIKIPKHFNENETDALLLSFNKPHSFFKNRIEKQVDRILYSNDETFNKNETILYYNCYLYKVLNNGFINNMYENLTIDVLINNTSATCVIPMTNKSIDDRYHAIYYYDDNIELYDYILKNDIYASIYSYDYKLITYDNGIETLRDGTEILIEPKKPTINIPLMNEFANNLFQTYLVENDFFNIEKQRAINPIINMEKYVFSPMCIDSGEDISIPKKFLPIYELEFNLHFRDRSKSNNWSVSDDSYWNSYTLNETNNTLKYKNNKLFYSIDQSDLIGYLNFTNNDILYQKSKVKKSFIRLLFYDNRDINSQRLLFYSTIFLDTGVLYGKYVNNLNTYGYIDTNGNSGLTGIGVLNEYNPGDNTQNIDESKRLSTRVTIHDKYNTDSCSEGFYLYLFADKAPKYEPQKIYMKVEFNHAGYGRTIPFIMPTINNVPIDPINNTNFPISYIEKIWNEVDDNFTGETYNISEDDFNKKNGDENKVYSFNNKNFILGEQVNMKRLYQDMYIEIDIKYDTNSNQYIWFVPRNVGKYNGRDNENNYNGKLVFNLFEPKIQ